MSNHFDLEFLTDDPNLMKLCMEYWKTNEDGEFVSKITDIAKEFGISSVGLGKFVEGHCNAYSTEIFCKTCGTPYFYVNRTDYQSARNHQNKIWVCEECQELERQEQTIKQQTLEESKRKIIREKFDLKIRQTIQVDSLTLENAVYLLSLARSCGSEDFGHAKPIWTAAEPFAPSSNFAFKVLKNLGSCSERVTANEGSNEVG